MTFTSNTVVMPMPVPNALRVVEDQATPIRTPEMIAHEAQIIKRCRRLDRAMLDYGAVGISPSVRSLVVDEPVAELGTFTYFSLRRVWATATDGRSALVCIVFAGYKSRLVRGRIEIGGPSHNVCAYDLRYRPFPEASAGGKILSSQKGTTIRIGLDLDDAVERCTKKVTQADPYLRLPQFWAGFSKDSLPAVEDCPGARKAALDAVRPGYEGQVLPSLRSPGGKVTAVCPEADGGIGVLFDEVCTGNKYTDGQGKPIILPRTAVLMPYVREGAVIEKGAPLADFLPRRMYPNIGKVAELYGNDIADWLMQDAAAAADFEHHGLTLRRVELCPTQLDNAVKVYEDVRHLLDEKGVVRPQVVKVRNGLSPLCPILRDVVVADFANVCDGWVHKFKPMNLNSSRRSVYAGARG